MRDVSIKRISLYVMFIIGLVIMSLGGYGSDYVPHNALEKSPSANIELNQKKQTPQQIQATKFAYILNKTSG